MISTVPLTLRQLRDDADAGAIAAVTLRADGGAFVVVVDDRAGAQAMLVTTRDKSPRRFHDPLKALALLREIGMDTALLDARNWSPNARSSRRRPDSAKALRRVHRSARQYQRGQP